MIKLKPIGSIIRLKGNKSLFMIMGYYKNNIQENQDKIYDYCGCEYPIGFETNKVILFNDEDIDIIVFIGYQDNKGIEFRKKISTETSPEIKEISNTLEEGDVLNINGKEGIICIKDNYNNTDYVNIAFDNNQYNIYHLEKENNQDVLILEENKDIIGKLIGKWTVDVLSSLDTENKNNE